VQHQWDDLYICINEDEWQHHFEEDNYLPVKKLSAAEIKKYTTDKPFIKVAVKYELQQWNEIEELLRKKIYAIPSFCSGLVSYTMEKILHLILP